MQIFIRPPPAWAGKVAHWRLGCLRVMPVPLNLVARTRLEYPPTIRLVLLQIGQAFMYLDIRPSYAIMA